MTQTVAPKRSGSGETLQHVLNEAVGNLPVLFLEHRIATKLKLQDVKAPKGLARQIAEHILGGSVEPFATPRAGRGKHAVLVCFVEPVFDDYVIADMLMALRDEIPRSFAKAEAQLKKDDRAIRRAPKPPKHVRQKTDR